MILEITHSNFDTILAALWHARSQASESIDVELRNLMGKISNQRDAQVRTEAINDYKAQDGR